MTLFNPGQRPPQVTIAARVCLGPKNSFFRGPAFSKSIKSSGTLPPGHCTSAGVKISSSTENETGDGCRASPSWVMVMVFIGKGRWRGFVRRECVAIGDDDAAESERAVGEDEVFVAVPANDALKLIEPRAHADDGEPVVAMHHGRVGGDVRFFTVTNAGDGDARFES